MILISIIADIYDANCKVLDSLVVAWQKLQKRVLHSKADVLYLCHVYHLTSRLYSFV
jgi:hypothetical protein